MLSAFMLTDILLNVTYEPFVLNVVMLSVVMLNVIMQSVVRLNVIMLSVVRLKSWRQTQLGTKRVGS
jgi:hypothetical protein